MQLVILSEEHLRLDTAVDGDGFSVEGGNFGALQMLGASLALCTASVIHSYAETANLDIYGLSVEIRWEYAEEPHRVGSYQMTLHLPESVPVARHHAIVRAANTCAVHNTLQHSPTIGTAVKVFASAAEPADHHEHHHDHEA